jgi:hypothetical protein
MAIRGACRLMDAGAEVIGIGDDQTTDSSGKVGFSGTSPDMPLKGGATYDRHQATHLQQPER